jgi:hypothetical protein
MMVNEVNAKFMENIGPDGFEDLMRKSHGRGISWHLWRGYMNRANYEESLRRLKQFQTEIGQ